jgi:hypothetical protein
MLLKRLISFSLISDLITLIVLGLTYVIFCYIKNIEYNFIEVYSKIIIFDYQDPDSQQILYERFSVMRSLMIVLLVAYFVTKILILIGAFASGLCRLI